uniref:Cytochrome P450 n=1 Tax=Nothapodytes nimmoniana TaxID=159386 RepID=A0A7L7RB34_NOTNI|nr:cytochrome P450 [Nothapodytes nimmoniana]
MEGYVPQLEFAIVALLFSIICLWMFVKGKFKGKMLLPPQPTGAWPIIGHLHLLGTKNLFHHILGAMADKYGSIFCIRLGFCRVVVISSQEVAKECFTVNDKNFSTRPRFLSAELMAYDHAVFGFAPYGQYWRHIRKLAITELLSNHRLEMLRYVRDSEINLFMKQLYELCLVSNPSSRSGLVLVEMKQRFGDLAMNIIGRMIAGKKNFGEAGGGSHEDSRRCQKAMENFMHLSGLFTVSDAIPFLGWIDTMLGYKSQMNETAKEIDSLIGSWVEQHKQNRLTETLREDQDFIHAMLSTIETSGQIMDYHTDTIIKATCLALILGGHDTTTITLTWALSLLLNNRHALRKAQSELDLHVGRNRPVHESDIQNLKYLQAIVKETLRLYPAVPLSVAHEAMEDCVVANFHIPAGTRLMVNLWKLHRDPHIWSDPLKFNPERFLTEHINLDVRGQDFELIPFGSGRRMCPGITSSLQILHLTLARLLHGFNLGTISNSSVDMTESSGLTDHKATPLEVTLIPRLCSEVYMC